MYFKIDLSCAAMKSPGILELFVFRIFLLANTPQHLKACPILKPKDQGDPLVAFCPTEEFCLAAAFLLGIFFLDLFQIRPTEIEC